MSDYYNTGKINLSEGAIKFLESQTVPAGKENIEIDVDFIFQIETVIKNAAGSFNCTLLDNDSKYGGFLLKYEIKDGTPGVGDIIRVYKIAIAILPSRITTIYSCKNVKLIRRAMAPQVDPKKLSNISKKKSKKNYKNSVYRPSDNKDSLQNNNNNNNGGRDFDDSGCSLISSLTTFSSNIRLYLKCKVKNPIKIFVTKKIKKNFVVQSFVLVDTKGDEIQATALNSVAERLDQLIQKNRIYEIRKVNVQLAETAYNTTKCNYRLVFNELSQIIPAGDNGKFNESKLFIVPLEQIVDFHIGNIIDVFGFVWEDKGFQEITTKNEKVLKIGKLIIADDTMNEIELNLWEPFGNADTTYSLGDLIVLKNVRVGEFNGRRTLNTIDSTEIKSSFEQECDARLRKFFNEHQNRNEYKEIQGEMIKSDLNKFPGELKFIKEIKNTYKDIKDYKDRPVLEIKATVTKLNHSKKNFYIGCTKCHRKTETDVCIFCSCIAKKTIMNISMIARDASSNILINMFDSVAEKFLGIKCEDYEKLITNGNNFEENKGLISINERIENHTFSFVGKVKENIYNGIKSYRFNAFRFCELTGEKRKNLAKMLSNLLK